MKKIDKLLLSSFVGPFAVSFGIALLVLILQFLWLYIDDIAGKGVSIFVLMELIGYQSISFFPYALPIAILIASVMVMGNLAERYELSSMKSAGVSLVRIMRSLIFCAAGVALFSYVCADFIMPISNLKARTRLFDIRKQKPALAIEKGSFNEDFRQFVIRVGDKSQDGETIGQIMIEDQTNSSRMKMNKIMADSGQMYSTDDRRYFVMNLFNGTQYQEPNNQGPNQRAKFPFIRTHFKSWAKVWDQKEFEMNSTDESRFKEQRSMQTMNQLRANMDSLRNMVTRGHQGVADELLANVKRQAIRAPQAVAPVPTVGTATSPQSQGQLPKPEVRIQPNIPQQEINKPLNQYANLMETFRVSDYPSLKREAALKVKSNLTTLENRTREVDFRRKEYAKTAYELYTKYTMALVCFIFMFIGAPMGAIIRKGGFGYPILVSIGFFVFFVMMTVVSRKLAETFLLTPFWAAMVPCILLMPIGGVLTRKAMNDLQMFNTDRIDQLMRFLRSKFARKQSKEVNPL